MNKIEDEKKEFPCPKCKKLIKSTLHDIFLKKELKCSSCGSMYKFDSTSISGLRSAVSNLDNALKKYNDSYQKLLTTASILIKK